MRFVVLCVLKLGFKYLPRKYYTDYLFSLLNTQLYQTQTCNFRVYLKGIIFNSRSFFAPGLDSFIEPSLTSISTKSSSFHHLKCFKPSVGTFPFTLCLLTQNPSQNTETGGKACKKFKKKIRTQVKATQMEYNI